MTAEELVRSVIDEHLCPESPYGQETLLTNLDADSLDKVELVMAFEDKLDFNVPDEEIDKLQTVGDLVELVRHYAKDKFKDGINQPS